MEGLRVGLNDGEEPSGIEIPVSSRAYGKYRGKTKDGASIVDEGTYKFETFDFVQLPGIAHAVPKLAEHIDDANVVSSDLREAQDDPDTEKVGLEMALSESTVEEKLDSTEDENPTVVQDKVIEESLMDTAVLTKITEDKVRIEGDLARVMEERTQLTEQIGLLRSQNQMLTKQVQQYEAVGTLDDLAELSRTSEKQRCGGVLPPHWCSFHPPSDITRWPSSTQCGRPPPPGRGPDRPALLLP